MTALSHRGAGTLAPSRSPWGRGEASGPVLWSEWVAVRVFQTLLTFSGNALPQLALTRQLVERGHEVQVLAHRAAWCGLPLRWHGRQLYASRPPGARARAVTATFEWSRPTALVASLGVNGDPLPHARSNRPVASARLGEGPARRRAPAASTRRRAMRRTSSRSAGRRQPARSPSLTLVSIAILYVLCGICASIVP